MKIDLLGGWYQNRSPQAAYQRQLNLYIEAIPDRQGEVHRAVFHPTPGMKRRGTAPNNDVIRGLYKSSNGQLFAAAGRTLYKVTQDFTFQRIGDMEVWEGYPYAPVKFADNGINVIAVDGSEHGYYWDINDASHTTFKHIEPGGFYPDSGDPVGWQGSNYIDYADTYFIAAKPVTGEFYISDSLSIEFSPLTAKKSSTFDDSVQAAVTILRNVWLIGKYNTEIWQDTGGSFGTTTTPEGGSTATFPYELVSGSTGSIEFGCAATYSIAQGQSSIFWLAQSRHGGLQILQGYNGYQYDKISTFALDYEINSYAVVSDAQGMFYAQEGRAFYSLTFPTADKTWVYDILDKSWHERSSMDTNGKDHAWRARFHAHAFGMNLVSDAWSGGLMELDLDTYVEDTYYQIKRIRSFPSVQDPDNEDRLVFKSLVVGMDVGFATDPRDDPKVSLRWSDTRGKTWSNQLEQSLGKVGEYNTSISWNRLGMSRHRIFELEWTAAVKTSLNGIYIDIQKAKA